MRIDPNSAVGYNAAYVLCRAGTLILHDGRSTPRSDLDDGRSAFQEFCRQLDPNRYFVIALVPDDADRDVFFAARSVARDLGVHMQAPVETPEAQYSLWETYQRAKQAADVDDGAGG